MSLVLWRCISFLTYLAAAAAKSLQSCLTLCDPMDCSPPGSSVHGIFQARVGCHCLLWNISCYRSINFISPFKSQYLHFFDTFFICCCLINLYFCLFSFIYINWRLITLQYRSGFCHTLICISHGFTCVPHPEPPSHLPPYPIPLGHPSAPALSTCLMHQTWTVDLFHNW